MENQTTRIPLKYLRKVMFHVLYSGTWKITNLNYTIFPRQAFLTDAIYNGIAGKYCCILRIMTLNRCILLRLHLKRLKVKHADLLNWILVTSLKIYVLKLNLIQDSMVEKFWYIPAISKKHRTIQHNTADIEWINMTKDQLIQMIW